MLNELVCHGFSEFIYLFIYFTPIEEYIYHGFCHLNTSNDLTLTTSKIMLKYCYLSILILFFGDKCLKISQVKPHHNILNTILI